MFYSNDNIMCIILLVEQQQCAEKKKINQLIKSHIQFFVTFQQVIYYLYISLQNHIKR